MKKLGKALLGLIAAVAMLFTGLTVGAVPAMADGDEQIIPAAKTSYTITPPADNTHTYEVYQIFTGDVSKDKDGNKILSNVKWGQNGTNDGTAVAVGDSVPETVLDALKAVSKEGDQAKLDVIKKYVNLNSAPYDTVKTTKLSNVPAGYYLIKDKDGTVTGDDAYTLYIVQVVGDVTITPKSNVPTSEKKVMDKTDSNEDNSVTSTDKNDGKWTDSADYDFGDPVPFKLTGTVADNYDKYKVYKFTFHDTEAKGLKFQKDTVEVKVDGNTITTGYEVVDEGLTDQCTFEVRFADLKSIKSVKAGSVITVEYKSELTTDAKVGAEGNRNTMHLEFSNNPNDEQGGETGNTPPDTVIVFTYKTVFSKVSPEGTELTGAEFTLEKKVCTTTDGETACEYKAISDATKATSSVEGNKYTWTGLDAGDYQLVETKAPDGYNKPDKPIQFTITAEHKVLWNGDINDNALTSLNGSSTDGLVKNIKTTDGSVTADIENKGGSELPETGGIGTTILYVAGAACVIAAGVWFGLRRRNAR
ncbi:SpaA isopeptide-forming pilin-related protein [Bifidobacterium callitrichidarum]|uniref:Sortase n=1 Tax=Bifidobacterium callitrichidarum TaxID=2052941 RepID=A0A2U2N5K5_9BIFI|nr:SpaA isopeptide-forming pilin-related protein [Bifidobacterium callitrichidarum]PWG64420.1 sortase [Bifidobacterium callitrichidarum]